MGAMTEQSSRPNPFPPVGEQSPLVLAVAGRNANRSGDYLESFTESARSDIEALLADLRVLALQLSRQAGVVNVLVSALTGAGREAMPCRFHQDLGRVAVLPMDAYLLSDFAFQSIHDRALRDSAVDSDVHIDRDTLVRARAEFSDDLRGLKALTEALSARVRRS